MRNLANFVRVPLLLGAVAAMLAGSTTANAQGWRHGGYGGGYYHHNGWRHGGGYDNDWHRGHGWFGAPVSVYYGPHYYHYHNWGRRRYYWYNGNRWYLDLNTGIRIEL